VIIGIVRARYIKLLNHVVTENKDPFKNPIEEIMSSPLITAMKNL
jgi:hypothetical protein